MYLRMSFFLRKAKITKLNNSLCQAIAIFFLIVLQFSCKKEENNNIPLVEVNLFLNLGDPDFTNLQRIGGSVEITGGSRGIILYRISNEEIKAYDRHCTFQPQSSCALVSVDPTNITASDQCCGSSFLLSNGDVSRPPASTPLKQYNTSLSGNSLHISN